MAKDLEKKKFYSIIETDLRSKALAMHGIWVIVKLGGITYQAKPIEKLGSMKKDIKALKKLDIMVYLDGI